MFPYVICNSQYNNNPRLPFTGNDCLKWFSWPWSAAHIWSISSAFSMWNMSTVISAVPSVLPCDRCSTQNHCCLYYWYSGGMFWWSERVSFYMDVWMRSRSVRSHSRHLDSFSSSCTWTLSVLMMDSKAQWFSQWRSRLVYLSWKMYLLRLLWHVMECRGALVGTAT